MQYKINIEDIDFDDLYDFINKKCITKNRFISNYNLYRYIAYYQHASETFFPSQYDNIVNALADIKFIQEVRFGFILNEEMIDANR